MEQAPIQEQPERLSHIQTLQISGLQHLKPRTALPVVLPNGTAMMGKWLLDTGSEINIFTQDEG